jgi:hypothetical protein
MKEIFKPVSMGNWQNGFDNHKRECYHYNEILEA